MPAEHLKLACTPNTPNLSSPHLFCRNPGPSLPHSVAPYIAAAAYGLNANSTASGFNGSILVSCGTLPTVCGRPLNSRASSSLAT